MAPFPGPTSTWHNNTYPSLSASRPELSAKGKNVFITGGGSGIGAETAHHFAAAGASRIAIVGRREQPLLDTKASINQKYPGVDVFTTSADMMQKVAVDAVFASFARSGKIDVLISNAGYVGTQDLVHTADAEKYLEAISVNVTQALHVAQAFARHAADNAVVVETNSSAAHVNFASMAYSVGKLAVFRLWDLFAFEFPKMRVYHVQPGVVDTAMNKETGGVKAVGHEDHGEFCAQKGLHVGWKVLISV